jgi:hypothetical protein
MLVKRVRSTASKLGMEVAPGVHLAPTLVAPGRRYRGQVRLEQEGVEAGLTLEYLQVEPRVVVVAATRAPRHRHRSGEPPPTMVAVEVAQRHQVSPPKTQLEETVFKELYFYRNKEE